MADALNEKLRRAEIENAVRRQGGKLPAAVLEDAILKAQSILTTDAGGQWLSTDGQSAADVVTSYGKQYAGNWTGQAPAADRRAAYQTAKERGDLAAMIANAPEVK